MTRVSPRTLHTCARTVCVHAQAQIHRHTPARHRAHTSPAAHVTMTHLIDHGEDAEDLDLADLADVAVVDGADIEHVEGVAVAYGGG